MGGGSEITMLKAVPAQAGDGWRVFIQRASGRIQYISDFESLQDAENWIASGSELAERAKQPVIAPSSALKLFAVLANLSRSVRGVPFNFQPGKSSASTGSAQPNCDRDLH